MSKDWQCMERKPQRWGLGIVAEVTRTNSGAWKWRTKHDDGLEPSRDTAQASAEKSLEEGGNY